MKNDVISEIVFDLHPIKFSGKSSVKELAFTVHVLPDESNRLNEFLLKEMQSHSENESEDYAKQK
jgi:hypothetical protein